MIKNIKSGEIYFEDIKFLKRICIYYFGLGFFFSTKRGKMFMLEMMNNFIDDMSKVGSEELD